MILGQEYVADRFVGHKNSTYHCWALAQPGPGINRKISVFSESWEAGAGAGKNLTSLFKYLYYAQLLRLSGDTILWKKVLSYKS